MFVILLSSMQSLQSKFQIWPISVHYSRQSASYFEISEDDHPWTVNSMSFIWNDNMREKREANANATWRALIRDKPRGDGV
jgi:hypothetical protein